MNLDPDLANTLLNTRRQFLGSTGIGIGGIAMGALLGKSQANADVFLRLHFAATATRHPFSGKGQTSYLSPHDGLPSSTRPF